MTFTQLITNIAYTSNNAISNKSSLLACLDLFSMGVSASEEENKELIKKDLFVGFRKDQFEINRNRKNK